MAEFTKTEQKIADILSDGYRHKLSDLLVQIGMDELDREALIGHIGRMRKKLVKSEAIICELDHRVTHYRWVRLLSSGDA